MNRDGSLIDQLEKLYTDYLYGERSACAYDAIGEAIEIASQSVAALVAELEGFKYTDFKSLWHGGNQFNRGVDGAIESVRKHLKTQLNQKE